MNFKRIGTITLIWDKRTWFRNWNLSGVVVRKLTIPKRWKKAKRRGKSRRGRDGGKGSSSSRYSCKQHIALMLYSKLGVDLFSTSELLHPNMKARLRLIRARPNFYMISDNPNVSLGIVDSSLYARRIALMDDYHKNRIDMLAYTPVEFNYLETLQRLSSFLPDKTSSFKKTFSTVLQFVGLLLQWIQNLHSLELLLRILSGINNLSSDKLEYSEEVSQS